MVSCPGRSHASTLYAASVRRSTSFACAAPAVLEDETHQRLQAMGFRVRSRVKPHDAHLLGLPSLPGEVDHVAAYPDGNVIWVIDDKDLAEVYMPAEIAGGVAKFYDPGGEVDKLRAKVAAVAADSISVGAALGLDGRHRDVKGLFVTRRPAPAAFVTSPPIEFTILDDLLGAVASSDHMIIRQEDLSSAALPCTGADTP